MKRCDICEKPIKKSQDICDECLEDQKKIKKIYQRRKQRKERKREIKRNRLTEADHFIIDKYENYLRKTLVILANREQNPENFHWDEDDYRINNAKNKLKHVIYIDELSLFKDFVKIADEFNIPDINPKLFRKALENIQGSNDFQEESFFIEKIKISKKPIFRVLF
ncbi:hypothetical protein KY342_00980 [Candidatus Woesearchaeota archaeon]|nr:hypothetical protein [Candidatus Woesearchaeota archaeon]